MAMRRIPSLRRRFATAFTVLAMISAQAIAQSDYQKRFNALLKRGVGVEVSFAGANASIENVRLSIDSAANFIRKRSGLELNAAPLERIAIMEHRTLKGERRRIAAH